MAARNGTSARLARTLHLQLQALELRRLGLGYREIATQLEIGRTQAHRLVTAALAESREQVAEAVHTIRAEEVSRLDGMMRGLWPDARKGHLGAIDRVLKIMERRAKLLGLDAPAKAAAANRWDDQNAPQTRYIVPVPAEMDLQEWLVKYAPRELPPPGQ